MTLRWKSSADSVMETRAMIDNSPRHTVLIVDDVPDNVHVLNEIINPVYNVRVALNGEKALKIARLQDSIDLILLDVMMPGMDGYEVCRHLKADPRTRDIPVVFVTAKGEETDESTGFAVGGVDYIKKPVSPPLLLARIRNHLALYDQNRELEVKVQERTAELRESEERFRAIFETAEDCVFVKDEDLRYTHVNPAMLKLLGIEENEILGKTDREIFEDELATQLLKLEARVLQGQNIATEHTITWKQDLITLSALRVPMSDLSGNRVGLCGIMRDVTVWRNSTSHTGAQIGEHVSQAMRVTLEQVRLAAETDSTVLFLGESGSGKDHLAKYLHDNSARRGGPFFAINCAAITRDLAESELFGHEAGAFTGTRGRKRGLVELAEGGTLLLNEIGELPLPLQAKLLAFLDTQSFSRVGGEYCVTVNARVIAATNRNLEKEVECGNFRNDLFYRLNVFPIRIPPLRERKEDLPALVQDLLQSLSRRLGLHMVPEVDQGAMKILASYHWPGNVRELKNILERALILCDKRRITEKQVTVSRDSSAQTGISLNGSFVVRWSDGISMNETLNQTKRFLVEEGLRRSGGSIKDAASLLGISRGSLKHYLQYLGIQR